MPHPPLCIWACSHDRSLQPLYLLTFDITMARVTSHEKNRSADGLSSPMMVVSEPEQGSSKANPTDSSMTDSQFQEHQHQSLHGLALASGPSPGLICPLTPYGLVAFLMHLMVCIRMRAHAGGI